MHIWQSHREYLALKEERDRLKADLKLNRTRAEAAEDLVQSLQQQLAEKDAALKLLEVCECGHGYAAHHGHAYPVGGIEPEHCAVACLSGCRQYRPKRIAELEQQLINVQKNADSFLESWNKEVKQLEQQLAEKDAAFALRTELCDAQRERIAELEQQLKQAREALRLAEKYIPHGKIKAAYERDRRCEEALKASEERK